MFDPGERGDHVPQQAGLLRIWNLDREETVYLSGPFDGAWYPLPVLAYRECVFIDLRDAEGRWNPEEWIGIISPSWIKKARRTNPPGLVRVVCPHRFCPLGMDPFMGMVARGDGRGGKRWTVIESGKTGGRAILVTDPKWDRMARMMNPNHPVFTRREIARLHGVSGGVLRKIVMAKKILGVEVESVSRGG